MKRLFTLFCAAGLLLALAACGRQAEEPASTLKPHVFSAETETIIDLLTETNEAFCLYDYDVDETIRSCHTTLWSYENGAWVSKAQSAGNLSAQQGQFGFYLDRNGSLPAMTSRRMGIRRTAMKDLCPFLRRARPPAPLSIRMSRRSYPARKSACTSACAPPTEQIPLRFPPNPSARIPAALAAPSP